MKYRIYLYIFLSFLPLFIYGQANYLEFKANTEQNRIRFNTEFKACQADSGKEKKIISDAQNFLMKDINNYFEAWYNTPWAFHGHTRIPGKGTIACGYFITTTLQDIGFKIPRIKWAQMASEDMIKRMTTDIKRFRKAPMDDIIKYIKSKGEGLYVVGLDCHVGYIYYYNNQMQFVHSNYYRPSIGVMSEALIGKNPLNDSNYRIIGKIFDENMVKKWIAGTDF